MHLCRAIGLEDIEPRSKNTQRLLVRVIAIPYGPNSEFRYSANIGSGITANFFIGNSGSGIWRNKNGGGEALKEFLVIRELFIRYNTAFMSSASVERLFSAAKSVLAMTSESLFSSTLVVQQILELSDSTVCFLLLMLENNIFLFTIILGKISFRGNSFGRIKKLCGIIISFIRFLRFALVMVCAIPIFFTVAATVAVSPETLAKYPKSITIEKKEEILN